MKILYYIALFILFIGYVIASGDIINTEFCEAVDQGNLNTAVETWKTGNVYNNAKYLVGKAELEFIVEFAKQAQHREKIVAALYTSGPEEEREKVFEKVSFTEYELANAALNPEIPCQLEYFLDLLERIMDPSLRDWLIDASTSGLLIGKRAECIDPLLNALKDDKDLEYKAAQKVFRKSVYNCDEAWVRHSYNHPAITSKGYTEVLIELVLRKGVKNPLFTFLLNEADQDDLKALLNDEDYKKLSSDIRFTIGLAIKEALPKIKPAGSRHDIVTSRDDWTKRYPEEWKSRLYMVLAKGSDPHSRTMLVYIGLQPLLPFICDSGNVEGIREVLRDTGMIPLDMYNIFVKKLLPEFAVLAKDYYKEQRDSLGVSNEFNEFDVKFYRKLSAITSSLRSHVDWYKLKELSNKKEVICEAAFFYGLIDFERAITCLDSAPPTPFDCKVFSNFVADMYFGEASRPDFSYEGDVETRKWLDDMVIKYQGSQHSHTSSLMRHFTRNIRGKVEDKLWNDYMRAMMTVHLSAALLKIKVGGLDDLYNYLADNRISDEYMFASSELDPLQHGQIVHYGHAFLRTFKLDPSGETATMGIINSGDGIRFHDRGVINLSELPDTISRDPRAESVIRFIPFIVYDEVPRDEWELAYTETDSMDKAYFDDKQKKHEFNDYKKWQYIDYQRAGTCTAMSLWSGLYWFERESQQKLESFRLALYLEVLKEAAKEFTGLHTELEELDAKRFETADDERRWNELQAKIKEKSEVEDDYLRFFSVGFNSAIRSIRYLHTDPFNQGLNMTSIMQDYAAFYESQVGERYWQLVKPNIDDLFYPTYLRVLDPSYSLPSVAPKISVKERDCADEVNQTIKARNPFNFVKAVIRGTDLKCQSKTFLAFIQFGVDALVLQIHHQDLILRALTKEIRSLSGGRLPILRLVDKLINDYSFTLFPTYDVPPTESIDFVQNIYQVVLFEDDAEMKQFAANCAAFDLLGKNVLAAAYDLVKSATKSLSQIETQMKIEETEEYKLHKNLVQRVAGELQSMDPYIHVLYISNLIWNAEQTGIAGHLYYFEPSKEWNQDDYSFIEHATRGSGSYRDSIKAYFERSNNLNIGQNLASKMLPSLPSNLSYKEYICAGKIGRAVDEGSPLGFVKAVTSGTDDNCGSELFLLSITFGIETLKLQAHHQNLILHTILRHYNAPQMLPFIYNLVTKYGFKLFLIDDTLPEKDFHIEYDYLFFLKVSELETDDGARQLAANVNEDRSSASIILTLCTKHSDLAELRSRFVDRVFEELREMTPHLYSSNLSHLIRHGALKVQDFGSTAFMPSTEWNHYDYASIGTAVNQSPQREEYGNIFHFPEG